MPAALSDLLAGFGPDVAGHVLRAIERVPRHHFVAEIFRDEAYKDCAIPIGHGVSASRPSVIARMLSLLGARSKVLEIGTGSGWQTALLSTYAETFSIECVAGLHERARRDLASYPVNLRLGDGRLGWQECAPFDGIIVSAAVSECPPALFDQLAPDGVMVLPLGNGERQQLCRIEKSKNGTPRLFGPCGFTLAA